MKKRKGFTLMELIIVVIIIAALSAVAVTNLAQSRVRSRDTRRLADLKQIQTALQTYFADRTYYPLPGNCKNADNSPKECAADALTADLDSYLKPIPKDPLNDTNHQYQYLRTVDGQSYGVNARIETLEGADLSDGALSNTSRCRAVVGTGPTGWDDMKWCSDTNLLK